MIYPLLKKDSELHEMVRSKKGNRFENITSKLFKKAYAEIGQNELTIFADNIIRRMYLLSKFMPPAMADILTGVLAHPNLSLIDRNVSL